MMKIRNMFIIFMAIAIETCVLPWCFLLYLVWEKHALAYCLKQALYQMC